MAPCVVRGRASGGNSPVALRSDDAGRLRLIPFIIPRDQSYSPKRICIGVKGLVLHEMNVLRKDILLRAGPGETDKVSILVVLTQCRSSIISLITQETLNSPSIWA